MHYAPFPDEHRATSLNAVDEILIAVNRILSYYHQPDEVDNIRLHFEYLTMAALSLIRQNFKGQDAAVRQAAVYDLHKMIEAQKRTALYPDFESEHP